MRSFVDFGKNHKLPAVSPAYWKLAETASKVELLQRIDVLEEENKRLKAEVARLRKDQNREVRTAREKPFGNDTPFSKITFKPDCGEQLVDFISRECCGIQEDCKCIR